MPKLPLEDVLQKIPPEPMALRKARPYRDRDFYADCPHCGEAVCLGLFPSAGDMVTCGFCRRQFEVSA